MAIEIRFKDSLDSDNYLETKGFKDLNGTVQVYGKHDGNTFCINLDITTAIKFAKTVRTEINKAKAEVDNG